MKKTQTLGIMALSIFMLAPHAQAQDIKPYIGIGGGVFALQYKESGLGYSISQRNPTWGAFLKGGADFNEYVGAEVRLGMTGNPATDWPTGTLGSVVPFRISTKIDNFVSYLLKVGTPVGSESHIHAYIGGTTAKVTGTLSVSGLNFGESSTKTGVTFGAGYDFTIGDNAKLGLEWIEYWTDVNLGSTGGSVAKGSFRGLSATIKMTF